MHYVDRIVIYFLLGISIAGAMDSHRRLLVLEAERAVAIEKEKNVVGYWTIDPETCQLTYTQYRTYKND